MPIEVQTLEETEKYVKQIAFFESPVEARDYLDRCIHYGARGYVSTSMLAVVVTYDLDKNGKIVMI